MLGCSTECDQARTTRRTPPTSQSSGGTGLIQGHRSSLTPGSQTALGCEGSSSFALGEWVPLLTGRCMFSDSSSNSTHKNCWLFLACFLCMMGWGFVFFFLHFFSCMLGFPKKNFKHPHTHPPKKNPQNTQESHLSTKSHSTKVPSSEIGPF